MRFPAVEAIAVVAGLTACAEEPKSVAVAMGDPAPYRIFFDFDSVVLGTTSNQRLQRFAVEYSNGSSSKVCIVGYADTSGDPRANAVLSSRRAEAVAKRLVELGVPAEAITTYGLGGKDLLVQTPPGVQEPQNRVVRIWVTKPERTCEEGFSDSWL